MWLKQQGETTTTVDRLTAMQEEIQSLKLVYFNYYNSISNLISLKITK